MLKGALEEPLYLLEYADVLRGTGVILHPRKVSAIGSDKVSIPINALVYGKLDPDAGRIAITPQYPAYIASSEFVPLEVSPHLAERQFVKAVLLLPEVSASLALLKAGKCQQRADVDKLLRCSIPLPDLQVQNRILGRLEPKIAELEDAARRVPGFQEIVDRGLAGVVDISAGKRPRMLLSSLQSVSAGGLLRNGYRYLSMTESFLGMLRSAGRTLPLSRIAKVRGGKRVPPKLTQYRIEQTGYQFLRGSDVGDGRIKADQLSNIDKDIFDSISISAPGESDVLLTVAGVVGKAAWPGPLHTVAVTDNVSLLTPRHPDRLRPEFLMYLLLSSFMQFQMKKEMSELRQQKIGLDKLRSLRVPELPTIDIQDRILITIRAEFEEAQRLRSYVTSVKRDIDTILRMELGLESVPCAAQSITADEEELPDDSEVDDDEFLDIA